MATAEAARMGDSSGADNTASAGQAPKHFSCKVPGCGRSFTRAEHLRRHALNHGRGRDCDTCPRCAVTFTRTDLLARHMARHAKRDEEAGGPGLGVLETRKRSRRDADGTIVLRPRKKEQRSRAAAARPPEPAPAVPAEEAAASSSDGSGAGHPMSPPPSLHETTPQTSSLSEDEPSLEQQLSLATPDDLSWFLGDETGGPAYQDEPSEDSTNANSSNPTNANNSANSNNANNSANSNNSNNSYNNRTSTIPPSTAAVPDEPPLDLFYTDTASSFNFMPFSTSVDWLLNTSPSPFDIMDPYMELPPPDGSRADFSLCGQAQASPPPYAAAAPNPAYLPLPPAAAAGNPPQHADVSLGSLASPVLLAGVAQPQMALDVASAASSHSMSTPGAGPGLDGRPGPLPVIDDVSRGGILRLISLAQPKTIDGVVIDTSSALLSPAALQHYSDLFFTRFNVSYPLIHEATFAPAQTDPLLLTAILLLGATYDGKKAHQMAVGVHDVLRPQIIQHPSFTEQPDLWVLQTILLVDCFGTSRAGQRQHAMSNMFHGLLINLIRRCDCHNVRTPPLDPSAAAAAATGWSTGGGGADASAALEARWRQAMLSEQRKRLALLCFLWDTQHAVLFSQASCLSASELRLSLPCDAAVWEAASAEAWRDKALRHPRCLLFLTVLKAYLHPNAPVRPRGLDGFSRTLILHGLMSVSSDLKRRDQISLGISDVNSPQERVRRAYNLWEADFNTYAMDAKLAGRGYNAKRFIPFKTTTLAIYRAAHIALNVEILDLQIFAGAHQILGKPVTPQDYDRSQRIIKAWLSSPALKTAVGRAAWHTCRILRDCIVDLDEGDLTDVFHYPWCLYLASLACWTFHFSEAPSADPSYAVDQRSEMTALVSGMTSCDSIEELNSIAGHYKTRGMIAFMTKQLSTVRWAVIREGMKVLEALG